jgi:hypothetical protein
VIFGNIGKGRDNRREPVEESEPAEAVLRGAGEAGERKDAGVTRRAGGDLRGFRRDRVRRTGAYAAA